MSMASARISQISLTPLLISVYSGIAHLYTESAEIDFVHLCVFAYHLDVSVCSQPAHVASPLAFPLVKPACADEAVGRGLLIKGKPEGPFW